MKFRTKLLSLLLAVLIFASLGAMTTPVQAADGAILATSDIYTRQDEDFTTTLYITEGANICDFQVSLRYDTELLTLVNAKAVSTTGSVQINTATPGSVVVVYVANDNVTTAMDVVELTFHVDENAGIGVYDCMSINESFENYASSVNNDTGAYDDVAMDVSFSQLVLYEMGDVNLDQKVNSRDVSTLKRHLTYLATTPALTDFHLRIADAERDDVVNMRDVVRIMRHVALFDDIYGDRLNIYFYDSTGAQYAVKSVLYGGDLTKLPTVPTLESYEGGAWSASPDAYVEPNLTGITKDMKLYAVYGEYQSDAIAYYKKQLTAKYYGGDLPTGLTGTMQLDSSMNYQSGYHAEIIWQSSNSYILNGTTGAFNQPTYATELVLTALITSYDANNVIEAEDSIDFVYQVGGIYDTPTLAEIETWIKNYFTDTTGTTGGYLVNYDVKLPQSLSDEYFSAAATDNFEVRISWNQQPENAAAEPITHITRTTTEQTLDLTATVTFNGKPLEGHGQVYLDNVTVAAIEQTEIKNYIIEQIADNVPTKLSEGWELWDEDTKYGTTIVWESGNVEVATVDNNVVDVNQSQVNGTLLPLTVTVSYAAEDEAGDPVQKEFSLAYTASVITDSTVLTTNDIDATLYEVLVQELKEANGFNGSQLTTAALRAQEFVSLDLSDHPEIKSLKGLSYCTNLRALDISGLHITDGTMNQIATLSKLEALIARGCGLDSLSVGTTAVLDNAVHLKLLDLSDNNFTSLDSVLGDNVTYGELQEVYLTNNQLRDISALANAPALSMLSLGQNGLTSEDLDQLVNFPYLNYLSLADNDIDSVEPLATLTNLVELRLQNNRISDITELRKLIHLQALYLSNNAITSGVEYLKTMTQMQVLYLNDNDISTISALSSMTKLRALNISNNPALNDLSVLRNCKDTIEEIYAENNSLTSFNFIEGMTKLRVLMLSGNAPEDAASSSLLTGHLSALTELEVLTLSDKPLLDLNFLAYMPELIRLDVANCGLTAFTSDNVSNIASIAARYSTLKVLDISNNDFSGSETELLKLQELSNLVLLYADNTCNAMDINALVKTMPQLGYISMENCGVSDLSWMSSKYNLVYVDLAGSSISNVDLSSQIALNSLTTLEYLYLDTNVPATFANFYSAGVSDIDLAMKHLSLEGITVPSVGYLPKMDQLTWLNLQDTGLTDLMGTDEFGDEYPITRFEALQTLDLSGLELELAPVAQLQNLKTLYAVNDPATRMFYKSNLHTLQSLYNDSVTCYLYDDATVYAPVALTEGTAILNLIEDFSCGITVAADYIISDNNPVLPAVINDYEITWTVSNDVNYEIVNNQLAVKSYANIDDETLTLTAAIQPYDDQETVTRDFTIDVTILRPTAENRTTYVLSDIEGYSDMMQRGDTFHYDIDLQAAQTGGFSVPVKPVVDEIVYTYSSVLASGSMTPYPNVLEDQGDHSYLIRESAPLNSTTTILVELVHYVDGETIVDDAISTSFTVEERTYTVTYVTNGGKVLNANGLEISSQQKGEESELFADITVERTGYLFAGWYTDEALTQLFWAEVDDPVYMPAGNLTLYAKWTAHSFNLYFDANGGTVSEASRLILCDTAFGELPVPTREGYTFDGWYTADGTRITADTTIATAEDVTVYAQWILNEYTVSWETGTGYTITVTRTESPIGGGSTGTLTSGSTVYYGDVLTVQYTADTGYSLSSTGATSITVTRDITEGDIYASAKLNSYTYNIVYKSSNGTALGTGTATNEYGSSVTIYPRSFSGYTSPASQTIIWDSTTAKTITFVYTPIQTTNPKQIASGTMWTNNGNAALTYVTKLEYRNRTATSVQVRVVWTNNLIKNHWYGYAQYFTGSVAGTSTGQITINSASAWSSNSSSARSKTVYSGWITVSLSTTNQTNVSASGTWKTGTGANGSWSGSITIPAY